MREFDFRDIQSRVSIRDVLAKAGIKATQKRIPCPIHGGANSTSFLFTDSVFYCFSCGANGGLLSLTEYLFECGRQDALKRLSEMAGLATDVPFTKTDKTARRRRLPITPMDPAEYRASEQLEWLQLERYALEVCLRILRKHIKSGELRLVDYFTKELIYLEELSEIDEMINLKTYELNQMKRKKRNNDKNTTSRDKA